MLLRSLGVFVQLNRGISFSQNQMSLKNIHTFTDIKRRFSLPTRYKVNRLKFEADYEDTLGHKVREQVGN